MPYRKEKFVNGEIYHITMHRIADKLLFKDIDDRYRGIFSIYEFNNANSVTIQERRNARSRWKRKVNRGRASNVFVDMRDKLVEVFCFCLMGNHIHLLLRQLKNNGVSKFISKVGTGLGGYLNRKYQQKGHVFRDRFYAVRIKDDNQLKMVFTYIHINPIAIVEPGWKEEGIRNPERVIKFLEQEYRWSSYWDYLGKENFPSVTTREFLLKIFGGPAGCREFVNNWIRHKGKIKKYPNLSLE